MTRAPIAKLPAAASTDAACTCAVLRPRPALHTGAEIPTRAGLQFEAPVFGSLPRLPVAAPGKRAMSIFRTLCEGIVRELATCYAQTLSQIFV